ncbi:MAG: hypothetical protein H0W24_05905 [Lysobacter sp.]|nr:hypothetical protein [Lysobacter sp.]
MDDAATHAGAGLLPPIDLAPPGGCRAPVSDWPRLLSAVDMLSCRLDDAVALRSRYGNRGGASLGGPPALMTALAYDAMLLSAATPPADIYSHFVWFMRTAGYAAHRIAGRLRALPSLWPLRNGSTAEQGALVREALGGTDGLAAAARGTAGHARALRERLGDPAADLEAARERYRVAAEALSGDATCSLRARDAVHAQVIARATAGAVAQGATVLESAGAATALAAVLTDLAAGIDVMAQGWERAAAGLDAALDAASDEELGDETYVREVFRLDDATRQWANFARSIDNYSAKRLS